MGQKVRLLIVDDEEMFRKLLSDRFSRHDFEVTDCDSGEVAMDAVHKKDFDVGIIDIRMPGINGIDLFRNIRKLNPHFEAIILTGAATVDTAVEAMKHGVYDYLTKPCKLFELELVVMKAYEKYQLKVENARLKSSLIEKGNTYQLTGNSEKITKIKKLISKLTKISTPITILGESGTGKEYFAKSIHQAGKLEDMPFISMNCGVHTHGILENYLFGYEKDTFTGAVASNIGWLQMATGGTLYMEDIDELHPSTQFKLQRYLETGSFQKVGSNVDNRSTARIIATSGKDLRDLVIKKSFRDDLYYNLNVITVEMPSLKDRKEDIPDLIKQFLLEKFNPSNRKKFSNKAVNAMLQYDWPGNIRELLNVVERASMIATKKTITANDMPMNISKKNKKGKRDDLLSLKEIEKEHILYVLNATAGNISRASRVLGVSRPKLYRKISQYKTGKAEKQLV